MGRRRKLSQDVTPSEIRRMMAYQQMSVAEIAKTFDVSRQTIYNYLKHGHDPQPDKALRKKKEGEPIWQEAHSISRLRAGSRIYELDVFNQTAVLKWENQLVQMEPDVIHSMINELTYIEQVMMKWRNEYQ